MLKREDQGVSFHEFFHFILSPAQQDKLETIIRQLVRIEELAEQAEGLQTVGRMMPLLVAEAEKVTWSGRQGRRRCSSVRMSPASPRWWTHC